MSTAPDYGRRKEDYVCPWHAELESTVKEDHEFISQVRGVLGLLRWIGFSQLLTLAGLIAVLAKVFDVK